jgi:uncharacterized protein (TIGR01777 family)
MHVLLTGGTGFLGRFLINALVERGDEVTVVSRRPEKARVREGVHVAPWLPDLAPFDAVVHLAGEPLFGKRWTQKQKKRLRDSRVETTAKLAGAIAQSEQSPGVFVSASAVGIYGERGQDVLLESADSGFGFLADLCRDWEEAARSVDAVGWRRVHPRIGVVLHPDGGALRRMLPPFRLGLGGPIGDGRQAFPWIHLEDWVGLLLFCLDNAGVVGPVNVVAPYPVTNSEFTQALGSALHRPAFLPLPKLVLRLLIGEAAEILTSSQRCSAQRAETLGYEFLHPRIGQALYHLLA